MRKIEENYSATVLEHLMIAERKSFIEAVRAARSRMLEEDKAKDCSKAAIAGLSALNGAVGLGAIAVGATASGLGALAIAGTVFVLSKQLEKNSNHASLEGEQLLWTTTDVKAWLVQAWQAGYPVGQILTAYSDFCEEVYLSQMTNPKRHCQIKSAAGFVKALNQSPDQFSGTPPVVKVGQARSLPMPLEDEPADFFGGVGQMLDAIEEEPVVKHQPLPPDLLKKIKPQHQATPKEDLWAEETVANAIAKAFPEAVATKALEMEHQYAVAVQEEAEEIATASRATTAKERLLSSPYTSRFFCGAQRTGKSYLAATAAQEMGCSIYHMNLASNLGNAGDTEDERYWKGAKRSLCCDLSRLEMEEAAQKIAEAIDVFNAFDNDPQPALLIVDEWTGIGSLFHRHSVLLNDLMILLASRAQSLATSGKKQKKAIWAIAPQFVAGNLSQPAKAAKSLNLCYVTVPPARAVTWDTESIRFSSETFDQIKKNFPIEHPGSMWRCDRIAWVDDRWLPVGRL